MKENKAVYVTKHKIRRDRKIVYQLQQIESDDINFSSQVDKRDSVICTCRKNVVKAKNKREMRYYSDVPKFVYACQGSRVYTDVGIGSVKEIQRRKVKKVYLPETEDRGVGSSDLSAFIGKRGHNKISLYKYKKTSSKCVGGEISASIHEKTSPIKHTKSETTSHEENNTDIGSNTVEKTFTTASTQFENEKDQTPAEQEEKVDVAPRVVELDKMEQLAVAVTVKGENDNRDADKSKKEDKKPVERMFSSDSLVQHVHNLEDPSFEKHSKGSFQDPMENKLEREYRKMFSIKSKDSRPMYERSAVDKSASALRRRFEVLRRGLAKKEACQRNESVAVKNSAHNSTRSRKDASVSSDPPSLIARSLSNTKKHSPIETVEPEFKVEGTLNLPKIERPQISTDSESQGVKGMFKLWGKKFNFEDEMPKKQSSPFSSLNNKSDKNEEPIKQPIVKKVESPKKEGKKFFFFRKKGKKVQPETQTYQPKKEMTTGRCEIKGQMMPVTPKEDVKVPHGEGDITRKAWFKNFVSHTIDSGRSVNVRWCNSLYATSSSTLFELMDTVYKNYGVVIRSRSETTTEESSFYKSYTKHRVNFLQDVEAWMMPKTIPDRSAQITIIKNKPMHVPINSERNVSLTISNQKFYIEKSEGLGHDIEFIVHRGKDTELSSEYLRIDIPKNFFVTSSSEKNHSSDEEVYKIVEYETASDIRKKNVADMRMGDQPSTNIKVIVSVQDSDAKDSKVLETVIKRPPTHRDVLIQGSNVNISKRCDVIGVGIITQRDIMRDIPKPILKIQDDITDDDIEEVPSQPSPKKCEFAESYLHDYYQNWTRSGADLPGLSSCCGSDYHLQSSSDKSFISLNQGDGTKSCPNIYEDCQTSLSSSSHVFTEDKTTDCFLVKKNEDKKKQKKEEDPFSRALPKDSLEVFKKRKLYACSNKSAWRLSCDKPISCPSKSSDESFMSRKNSGKCHKHVTIPGQQMADASTRSSFQYLDKSSSARSCQACKMRRVSCDTHATIPTPEPVCVINRPPCEERCEKLKSPPCHAKNAPSCNVNVYVTSSGTAASHESSTEIQRVQTQESKQRSPQCPSGLSCNKKIMAEVKKTKKRPDIGDVCPVKPCVFPPCEPPTGAPPCIPHSPCPFPPCLEHVRKDKRSSKASCLSESSDKCSPKPCPVPAPCTLPQPSTPPKPCKSPRPCTPPKSNTPPRPCSPPKPCTPPKQCPHRRESIPSCPSTPNSRIKPRLSFSPPICEKASPPSPLCPNSPPCPKPLPPPCPYAPPSSKPSPPICQKPSPPTRCPNSPPCAKPSPPCPKRFFPPCPYSPPCREPSPPTLCSNTPPCPKPSSPPCPYAAPSPKPPPPPCQQPSPPRCPNSPPSPKTCQKPPPYPKPPPPCPESKPRTPPCTDSQPLSYINTLSCQKPSPPLCSRPASPPCYVGDSKPCLPPPILRYGPRGPCKPPKCTPCKKTTHCSRPTSPCPSPPRSRSPSPKPTCPPPPTPICPPPKPFCPPSPKPSCPPSAKPSCPPSPKPSCPQTPMKVCSCSPKPTCPPSPPIYPKPILLPPPCPPLLSPPASCQPPPKPKPCGKKCPGISPLRAVSPPARGPPISPTPPCAPKRSDCSNLDACPKEDNYPWPMKNQSNEPSPKCSAQSLADFNSSVAKLPGFHFKVIPDTNKCAPKKPKTCKKQDTPSTEEIREGMNIKVQDKDGNTLFERRDYGCGKNKPMLVEEIYKGASYHKGPVIFTNVTETQVDKQLLEVKSDPSLSSLIEIQLKLRIGQGNNKADINIANDEQRNIVKCDKKSDVFVLKQDKTKEIAAVNDMSIKITFRNLKAQQNMSSQISKRNKKSEEFSKKISEKFQTVSGTGIMGHTDMITGPDDDYVYSIHRATINLASSNEKTSLVNVTSNNNVINNDCKGDAEVLKPQSEDEVKDEKSLNEASKKDSETEKIEETFTEGTKSDLPECNDTDEQENTLLEASSDEEQDEKPTPNEEKKALLKKVIQKAHRTQHKSKSAIRQLRNMLKIILTDDSSDNNEITNSTSELVKDVTYTSLKPNYFRDTDSMNNYYQLESLSSKECNLKGSLIMNSVVMCDSEDPSVESNGSVTFKGCMCSKVAEKLKDVNAGCCCKTKSHLDEQTNCDKKFDDEYINIEYADVETQKSNQLFNKANSINISVHSKQVSAKLLEELALDHVKSNAKECTNSKENDKVFVLNRQINSKNPGQISIAADVLQSYETKKAVLEIYAEKTNHGEHLVAKLPKFVYDRESEITNNYEKIATNSYTVCEQKIVLMSLKG